MSKLNFDNTYARLPSHWYQTVSVTPLKNTHLISFNAPLAQTLGLNPCEWAPSQLVDTFTTEQGPEGAEPLAMKYTGHQFGVYNPDLGDGRGILLGEHLDPSGNRWDLHLKGAGKTAFSRFADGRAVLRSSIREYLVSEAMFGLGIPTTRALAIFGSEEFTLRNGAEPCAQVLRVTPCHIRFGHFEYFYYSGQHEDLKQLADYVIDRYYPDAKQAKNPYLFMYQQVVERSAYLVAQWQSYGFVHAVMNTDNMSIHGITFAYGPYAFLDDFEPHYICNRSDHQGRYRFSQQPSIGLWNLNALAQAFRPFVTTEDITDALDTFEPILVEHYHHLMLKRFGLTETTDTALAMMTLFMKLLQSPKRDYHISFRQLAGHLDWDSLTLLRNEYVDIGLFDEWLAAFKAEVALQEIDFTTLQSRISLANPHTVLRNHHAQAVIEAAEQGDFSLFHAYLEILKNPFDATTKIDRFAAPPSIGDKGIALSCSS